MLWEWRELQQVHIHWEFGHYKACHIMLPCSSSGLWGVPREVAEGESDLWAAAERLPLRQVDRVLNH